MTSYQPYTSLQTMGDEEVIHLSHDGMRSATECILTRYRPLVEAKARSFFVAGADREDVVQEGMVGLYKAIRDFQEGRALRFKPFAELCVTRQIISVLKSSTRHKHEILNSAYSLNQSPSEDDYETTYMDMIPDDRYNPEEIICSKAEESFFTQMALKKLSLLEIEVLKRYLKGETYEKMSTDLRTQTKTIDNALQRVKRKMGSVLIH